MSHNKEELLASLRAHHDETYGLKNWCVTGACDYDGRQDALCCWNNGAVSTFYCFFTYVSGEKFNLRACWFYTMALFNWQKCFLNCSNKLFCTALYKWRPCRHYRNCPQSPFQCKHNKILSSLPTATVWPPLCKIFNSPKAHHRGIFLLYKKHSVNLQWHKMLDQKLCESTWLFYWHNQSNYYF